jgi:hypothetical protein
MILLLTVAPKGDDDGYDGPGPHHFVCRKRFDLSAIREYLGANYRCLAGGHVS